LKHTIDKDHSSALNKEVSNKAKSEDTHQGNQNTVEELQENQDEKV